LPASAIGHGHHELRATYPTQPAAREICLATFGSFLKMRNCMPTGAESNLSGLPAPRTCSSLQRLARAADQIWIFLRPGPVFPYAYARRPRPSGGIQVCCRLPRTLDRPFRSSSCELPLRSPIGRLATPRRSKEQTPMRGGWLLRGQWP
jgi:hypothetical protein